MRSDAKVLHRDRVAVLVLAVALLGGVAIRFWAVSDLWLDEALSVNIARLPVSDMFEALRHDGHPPLYYLMLHFWMKAFGQGDLAVRALSGVTALLALPFAWFAGRRYGGPAVALSTLTLLASSPFAMRYATETRMYSLLILLVLVGWMATIRALERPSAIRLGVVLLCAGMLLLTHYWSFYLLAALVATIAWGAWRGRLKDDRRGAVFVMASVIGGGLLFVPWLPAFIEQASNTGTPWGAPARPGVVLVTTLTDFGGGPFGEAQLLGASLGLLALLALLGRRLDPNRIEIDLRSRASCRPEWAVMTGTMTLAVIAGFLSSSAFASRYSSIVLPLLMLTAARGLELLPRIALQRYVLAALVVVGLVSGIKSARTERTQAGELAATINKGSHPGDAVAFCPDQLGPSTSRLLRDDLEEVTYPDGSPPQRVNWVDYAERMQSSDPSAFARKLDGLAGSHAVWIVWSGDYRSVEGKCEAMVASMQQLRPSARMVLPLSELFEHAQLWVFEANSS